MTKTKEKPTIKGLSLRSLVATTLALIFAIALLTGTDNVLVATVIYGSISIIVLCRQRKRPSLYMVVLLGVLARVVLYTKYQIFTYRHTFDTKTSVIATGVVDQPVSEGVYTMSVNKQRVRYHTPYQYQAGDIIWFTAMVYPTRAPTLVYDRETTQKNWKKFFTHSGFDYNRRLYMKGIHAVLYEENAIVVGKAHAGPLAVMRVRLQTRAKKLLSDNNKAGLLLGLLLGDKSLMERRQYQEFIDSGLVHIVAVSGGNIVMVVAGAMIVLWRLPWYARTYTMMLIIIAYAVLVGPDSSIIRATIMGIVAYMALIQGRPVVVWRALCYAAILMLLWNPYFLLVDIGFVFSFASVIGLVIMQSRLQIAVKGKSIFKKSIIRFRNLYAVPTLSATVGVLPFLLYFTSSYNLLSIIANIAVLPLIPLIMIVGLLTLLTGWPRLLAITEKMLSYTMAISHIVSKKGLYIVVEERWFALVLVGGVMALSLRYIFSRYQKKNEVKS